MENRYKETKNKAIENKDEHSFVESEVDRRDV